jgi:hypothetical protein
MLNHHTQTDKTTTAIMAPSVMIWAWLRSDRITASKQNLDLPPEAGHLG